MSTARSGRNLDFKIEVVVIPVADVERAKRFYSDLGWRLDADFIVGEEFRGIQFTPPGSACSIHFGKGLTGDSPGSRSGLFLAVADLEAARRDLIDRGVAVSDIFHRAPGEPPESGPDPEGRSYASFASFTDPDGNAWLLQEVTARLPGRIDGANYSSKADLIGALRRAAAGHGEFEQRIGQTHDDWPEWYAEYMFAEQAGNPLPS